MTPDQMDHFVRGGLDVLAVNPDLTARQAVERWVSEQGLRRAFWATANPIDKRWITKEVKRRKALRDGRQ